MGCLVAAAALAEGVEPPGMGVEPGSIRLRTLTINFNDFVDSFPDFYGRDYAMVLILASKVYG